MRRPRRQHFRILTPFIVITSVLLTALVLFKAWEWLNPITFWEKLILLILTIVGAFILFLVFNFLMAIVFSFFFFLIVRRKIKKTFRKIGESNDVMYK